MLALEPPILSNGFAIVKNMKKDPFESFYHLICCFIREKLVAEEGLEPPTRGL